MKFMSFNNSCSFAGIANMLEMKGIDTADYKIALGMRLPYMMELDGDCYLSGSLLQTRDWFSLYLATIGFSMREKFIPVQDIISYMMGAVPCMTGVVISSGNGARHAVVYVGNEAGKMKFLNNKRKDSAEPDYYLWSEKEFLEKIGRNITVVADLLPGEKRNPDLSEKYERSLIVLSRLKHDVNEVCQMSLDMEEHSKYQNQLFRAFLLDNIAVLKLTQEFSLVEKLEKIQGQYLSALRMRQFPMVLSEYMDIELVNEALEDWRRAIVQKQASECENLLVS